MKAKRLAIATLFLFAMGLICATVLPPCFASCANSAQNADQPVVAKRIGTIKAINGNNVTLAPDSGTEVVVIVQPNARLLRLAPGEKDLKNTTPIQLQDLQVGD